MKAALISVPWMPRLDVGDEHVGDLVGAAGDEEGREVVVGVDAGAGHDLQAGLLGDPRHERDVAAEEHGRRIADRLDPELHRRPRRLDGRPVIAARLGSPTADRRRASSHRATGRARPRPRASRCSWISVGPRSSASIAPETVSILAMAPLYPGGDGPAGACTSGGATRGGSARFRAVASRKEEKERLRKEREEAERKAQASGRSRLIIGYVVAGALALVIVVGLVIALAGGQRRLDDRRRQHRRERRLLSRPTPTSAGSSPTASSATTARAHRPRR